jgi:hypothetical protein
MKANIKTQNYWMLKDIGLIGIESRSEVQGDKLKAIYRLIQSKGEPIKTEREELNGVKAYQFADGEYIAMKRTGPKDTFYPCALKTILLTDLKATQP